eukprot:m.149278 g.149278  ORF g.149278 m.149278 type:complete len:197 (+) comp17810_c0_seq1:118-708(+)
MGVQKCAWIVVAALSVAVITNARKKMRTTVLSKPEYCSDVVGKRDHAYIVHKGYYKGELIDANPTDDNGDPEPLKIVVGRGHVLAGMEMALEGMCLDEKVEIVIPPHLAYDDKSKGFKQKPVPDDAIVKYEMHVVDIQHPGTVMFALRGLYKSVRNNLVVVSFPFVMLAVWIIRWSKKAAAEAGGKVSKRSGRKQK